MRLEKIQAYFREKGWEYRYTEEDGCGSIDLEYRGIPYHIWDFRDGEGAQSNVRDGGRQDEDAGDYEEEILTVIKNWK